MSPTEQDPAPGQSPSASQSPQPETREREAPTGMREAPTGVSASELGSERHTTETPATSRRDSGSRATGVPLRLLGSGMELASYTLILGAAGYWIDRNWELEQPYVGIAGALVGFAIGMYRLIVLATRQG